MNYCWVETRARYAYDEAVPGRLFHEAIGARLGRRTFETLVSAIQALLTQPQQRQERERT
jgi:hypothetical protein